MWWCKCCWYCLALSHKLFITSLKKLPLECCDPASPPSFNLNLPRTDYCFNPNSTPASWKRLASTYVWAAFALRVIQLLQPMPLPAGGVIRQRSFDNHPWRRGPAAASHSAIVFTRSRRLAATTYLNHCLFIHQLRCHWFPWVLPARLLACLPGRVISRAAQITWQWLQFCHIKGRAASTPLWWVTLLCWCNKQWGTRRIHN